MDDISDEEFNTPPDLQAIANKTINNLLPRKSESLYSKQYDQFIKWCENNNAKSYTENVLIAYFTEKSSSKKSSTLRSIYSMLKKTLLIRNNVNIFKYAKLLAFLKLQNTSYKAKKSEIFSRDNMIKFFEKAPDMKYLMHKVRQIYKKYVHTINSINLGMFYFWCRWSM